MEVFTIALVLIIVVNLYFIPTMVARRRGHKDHTAILVLNVFFGWTFLGWVAALIWACTGENRNAKVQAAVPLGK